MTCAPRRLASPVWRWAHRMAGLERLISWLPALISTGGLIHHASWTPSVDLGPGPKRGKMNIEASQSYAGRKLIKLLGSNHIVVLQCCINTGAFRLLSTKRKPTAIGTLADSFGC